MSEAFEMDQATLADLINYTQWGDRWGRRPGFGIETPGSYQDLAWDPCLEQFVLVWGPPFLVPDLTCKKESVAVLVEVPVNNITKESLGASVQAITEDRDAVAPLLVGAAALQRLAEFHESEHPAASDLLFAAARDLFTESLNRARAGG
jgi:hypothetical protein